MDKKVLYILTLFAYDIRPETFLIFAYFVNKIKERKLQSCAKYLRKI